MKWLQFFVRRLYDVPWNSCEACNMLASFPNTNVLAYLLYDSL